MTIRRLILVVALAGASLTACKKPHGTCEMVYEEGSRDGSIPAGLAACLPDWTKEACDPVKLSSVTLGLKTSGYGFTQDATCEELGYQDCSGGRGISFYKSCPDAASPKPKAPTAAAEGAPSRKLDRPKGGTPGKPGKMTLDAALSVPDDAPFKGKADGKKVLHLFTDFQDPFSKRLLPTLDELLAEHDELKVVFRHHPLAFHRDAPLAHQAAIEAYVQKGNDGFWAMSALLFDNQRKLGRQDLVGYAEKVGLDVAALEKALDAGTHRTRLQQDSKVAEQAGMRGVPVMVLGTTILRGALPKSTIEEQLALP